MKTQTVHTSIIPAFNGADFHNVIVDTTFEPTSLDLHRFKGFSTGNFPGLPVRRNRSFLRFQLPMQRTLIVRKDGSWEETSPKGIASGRMVSQAVRIQLWTRTKLGR